MLNNKYSYSPQIDRFDEGYQMNCMTIPMTPNNNRINKQDSNQLRDVLLKYLVIEEDDSKFNFKQDDSQNSNHLDSQKSTFLSQYRKNINYIKNEDKYMEMEEGEEEKDSDYSKRGNFGKSLSHLFKTQSKEKNKQSFLTPRDEGQSYRKMHDTNKKTIGRQNAWNTDLSIDYENKKIKNASFSSNSSIDSSSSRDKKDIKSGNIHQKRNVKRPLTSIVQDNKQKKNNFAMSLTIDREAKQKKVIKDFTPSKDKPLQGKCIFVDVFTNDRENISESVHQILTKLGAEVKKKFTKNVDLVIWKDGSEKNYENADSMKIPILSIHWLEKCQLENKFIDTAQEYLVPKPHKMVSELSTRVDKIYQKYEKNREKEIKKKAKTECLTIPQRKRDDSQDDEQIMSCWQKTSSYTILQQKQVKDEIRCQEELEQYYHDIIEECFQGKFTQKWNKRNTFEPLFDKYEQQQFNLDNIYQKQILNNQQSPLHTSAIPETSDEKTLYVGIESMKKQQKTMQDFFGQKKIEASVQNNATMQLNSQSTAMAIEDNDNKDKKLDQQSLKSKHLEMEIETISLQSSVQLKEMNTQQNIFTAKKPTTLRSLNTSSQKPSVLDMLSKKKAVSINGTSSLQSNKKILYPANHHTVHGNSNLMRFGFSFKKVSKQDSQSQEDSQMPKILKIGYLNLTHNQIQQLQNCKDLYLANYELCGEKDHFQEDIIVTDNQLINSQQNYKGFKGIQAFNQLRILSLLTNNKDVVSFKWVEDCLVAKCDISTQDYRECNIEKNKSNSQIKKFIQVKYPFQNTKDIFTGFDFSIYLDQIQRKSTELMKQKYEIEKVIKYFGGRVLENSKSANYIIFFKQQSKLPQGYDQSNCIMDKYYFLITNPFKEIKNIFQEDDKDENGKCFNF